MRHLGKLGYPAIGVVFLVGFAQPAWANMPMFYVLAFTKPLYWWTLPLVVAIEAVAIHWIFHFSWKRAVIASTVVNLATLLVGAVAFQIYPIASTLFYLGLTPLEILFPRSGHLVETLATLAAMAAIDTVIELALLALIFKAAIYQREGLLFLLANIVSTVALLAPLAVS